MKHPIFSFDKETDHGSSCEKKLDNADSGEILFRSSEVTKMKYRQWLGFPKF